MNRPAPGRLVLVATPIGNLGDLSSRALDSLRSASLIACEDTRRTGRLLAHAGIERPAMIVVNEHTESAVTARIVERIADGQTVAVVSDAGTPGISDPGERLVAAVVAAGFDVGSVPGPSAAIAALVTSGLPTGRFVFEGFLARKGSGRTARLTALAREPRTMVIYEAPHRIRRTIDDLISVMGASRRVVLARELTKLHEEMWRGALGAAAKHLSDVEPRGEYVIVLAGAPEPDEATDDDVRGALTARLATGSTRRDAATAVAAALGRSRRDVYAIALEVDRPD